MMGSTNILLMIVFSHMLFDFAACSNSRCMETEWRALMDFKGSLIDEGNRLSSWTGRDCCSWEGITCHYLTGFVQTIDLSNYISFPKNSKVLGGHINSSLLNLERLEHLDLSYNNFSGIRIPAFLGSLRNLQHLGLLYANFSGKVPQQLGNLSNLQHLSISGGPFDEKLISMRLSWITQLSSLTTLDLTNIDTSDSVGWLDSVNMLPSLRSLRLYRCGLVDMALSRDLNLTSLVSIDLGGNYFNSTFPPSFFNLSSLEDITIRSANLRGLIPNMFQKLTSLNTLDLLFTSLGSSIPNSLCTLAGLTHIDFTYSNLQGSIPLCLGNLTNLLRLGLGGNELSGEIPDELGFLTHLSDLDLGNNQLSGRIPSALGKLPKLQRLDVYENSFIGELSESFFEGLKSLKSLSISKNYHFVLNVSPQWIPPFQLEDLDMDSVFIGVRPSFPAWLQTQTNLYSLGLRNTSISLVPDWCQTSFPYLGSLDLSYNLLTGHLPIFDVIEKSSFGTLTLSNNQFTGKIPDELCNLHSMDSLTLANNHLIGRIPSCLGNLQRLRMLDLANNNLSGHIPTELGYLNQLIFLRLNGNKLVGELPSSLQNLTKLGTLDLGENALQGSIPQWLGKEFLYLQHLMLQSNNFSGEIPLSLCQLSSLLTLNLPDNSLVGTIPHCLGILSSMLPNVSDQYGLLDTHVTITTKGIQSEYSTLFYTKLISLSGNQLHSNIPDELMNLTDLHSLNLSNNKLTGNIPKRIGNLKHLESLDLSMNHLSGAIPQSLAGIDGMGYLNLSFNNLSGRIPSGGHFDTFDDLSVYQGNGELCGKPTTNMCDGDSVPSKLKGLVSDGDDDSVIEFEWIYAGIGPGFAFGLLGVFCLLFFKSSWRYRYFIFLENVYNRL